MRYQVSYLSPNGHTKQLAEAIRQALPSDCVLMDLAQECEVYAETQIIGFEINEVSFRAVPYRIMELLNKLEQHSVILFVTTPFHADARTKAKAERWLEPFIPETCRYMGMYMCTGQATEWLLQTVRTYAERHPEDGYAAQRLQHCEESIGHPDVDEIQALWRFIAGKLKVDY